MKTQIPVLSVGSIILLLAAFSAGAQVIIPISNAGFDSGGGQIQSQLTLLANSSTVGPQQIGTSGWYGLANSANAGIAGFRPGLEVDNDASSADVGEIRYNLGASLGGLVGLEMPEADLWQPLTGRTLIANQTYTFSIDVDVGSLLSVSGFSDRGFGIGITRGASTTSVGTMVADTLTSAPALVNLSVLSGNRQRLSLTFNSGASPGAGDIGVVIFGGRGSQTIQVSLLDDFDVDNASLTQVPEPRIVALVGFGLALLLGKRHLRRTLVRLER